MPHEAGAGRRVRSLPQGSGDGAHALHHAAPAPRLPQSTRGPQPARQRALEHIRRRRDRRVRPQRMGAWQQASPRQGQRSSAPARAVQRQNHIHHGQARADDDHIVLGADPFQRTLGPRVRDHGARSALGGLRSRIAGGQHNGAGANQHSIRRAHPVRFDRRRPGVDAMDQLRPGPRRRIQPRADIGTIVHAGREPVRIGVVRAVGLQPTHEIVRTPLDRAHPAAADVQQMPLERRAIGRPQGVRGIDPHRRHALVRQAHSQHRPRKARADDGDAVGVGHGPPGRIRSPDYRPRPRHTSPVAASPLRGTGPSCPRRSACSRPRRPVPACSTRRGPGPTSRPPGEPAPHSR